MFFKIVINYIKSNVLKYREGIILSINLLLICRNVMVCWHTWVMRHYIVRFKNCRPSVHTARCGAARRGMFGVKSREVSTCAVCFSDSIPLYVNYAFICKHAFCENQWASAITRALRYASTERPLCPRWIYVLLLNFWMSYCLSLKIVIKCIIFYEIHY